MLDQYSYAVTMADFEATVDVSNWRAGLGDRSASRSVAANGARWSHQVWVGREYHPDEAESPRRPDSGDRAVVVMQARLP